MGLFSKLKANKVKPLSNDDLYKNIFMNISDSDESVEKEINACLENVRLFYLKNSDTFEARGIDGTKASEFTLKWIGCVDILIKYGYATEFDHSADFEDFFVPFGKLKIVERRNILPAEDSVYLDYEPISWLKCIDGVWAKSGLCIGGIDIDSDSYVVFPCTVEQLSTLSAMADEAGRRICRASEL